MIATVVDYSLAACQAREEAARELAGAAIARAERAERRALTDKLTAVPAQPRPRNRTTVTPEKEKQRQEGQHRPA